jgi:protein-disulfide isomerase
MLHRRLVLTLGLAAALAGNVWASNAAVAAPVILPEDMSMGSPKAKIQVIEYASLACPHCGHFNEAVFPALKSKYIDTGKAHYTLKEMITEPATVAVAGFLIARCAGPAKYFTVVDQVFRSQSRWNQGNIKPIFQEIAAANGVDEAHFNTCLQDQPGVDAIAARAKRAADEDGVDSTPTLFINGKRLETVPQTPEQLDAAIAAAIKGGR